MAIPVESGTVKCPDCPQLIHLGWTDEIPLPDEVVDVVHNNIDGSHKVIRKETPVPSAFHEQS